MSTAERKARKRAGIPFTKAQKEGTPFTQRSWFNTLLPDGKGGWRLRSLKKRNAALAARGLDALDS